MSGEDQERFEDYLELERYIEELQAGRAAHPPADLTPEKARIYRMAALFRSASPEEVTPRPEFAAELQARLEQELEKMQGQKGEVKQQSADVRHSPFSTKQVQKKPLVSRRTLLAGGAAAAASLVAGVGIGRAIESAVQSTTIAESTATAQSTAEAAAWATPIVPPNIATTWHFVTTLAQLTDDAVRFTTDTIVGYVIRDDGDDGDPDKGKIIALSASCTHMGCIVQWASSDRKYHCPCHGGLFSEYGHTLAGPIHYMAPLPRLETKVENGKVYVKVPVSK